MQRLVANRNSLKHVVLCASFVFYFYPYSFVFTFIPIAIYTPIDFAFWLILFIFKFDSLLPLSLLFSNSHSFLTWICAHCKADNVCFVAFTFSFVRFIHSINRSVLLKSLIKTREFLHEKKYLLKKS